MKWFLAVFLVCLAGIAVGEAEIPSVSDEDLQCQAGTEWESYCNQCLCLENGIAKCQKQEPCASSSIGEPITCKPNSIFKRGCNVCRCQVDGQVSCVSQCEEEKALETLKEPERFENKDKYCAPGTKWTTPCSECVCSDEGKPICTKGTCTDDKNHILYRCAPESTWLNSCNQCYCTPNGIALCTLMGCAEDAFEVEFNANDNEETDNEKGTANIELVIRSRINQPDAGKAAKVTCSPNQMFIKDCNTCWCNKDGTSYSCTRKACEVSPPQDGEVILEKDKNKPKQKCRPDEVFEMDCNMCRCNSDGTSFSCTRRACYPDDDLKDTSKTRKTRAATQELTKTCQPGQEFRLDCNKCLCDNEGTNFSCTRIDCNGLNTINGGTRSKRDTTEVISTNCTAGSVFNDDCNVCSCDAQGLKATCTTHSCDSAKSDNDLNSPVADPNFRCNPGEQFKRDCNDCTCTADGKSIFCTLRMCPVYKP